MVGAGERLLIYTALVLQLSGGGVWLNDPLVATSIFL